MATATPSAEDGGSLVVVPDVRVEVDEVARNLDAPWGIAILPDDRLLVSLRDERRLVVIDPRTGKSEPVGGRGADDLLDRTAVGGEAGLLGVVVAPPGSAAAGEVFIYRTTRDGNEVLHGRLTDRSLSALDPILTGIPAAGNHDGGQLAFGPGGDLFVATGDATDPDSAQDPASLGGKILRITVDGEPASVNPDAQSPVWSLGHRNVQGLGWDVTGRMFASEFGQNTYDELNVIVSGGNYGWPEREGRRGVENSDWLDPVVTWTTDEASPSGLAVTREGVYLAGLRGERLWRVPFAAEVGKAPDSPPTPLGFATPQVALDGYGRLRAVLAAGEPEADGSSVLYVLTNNTDGRGTPRAGDDRLLRLTITPR